ncbi:hypothetical protein U1U32_000021 [Cronobacter malonaticus]|nr:hypothetical protein [Cronobacter malonaticus]
MIKKSKAIARVERLLNKIKEGNFNDSDIEVLFVTLRDFPSAPRNIIEIGNFVAHNHQRNQGVINDIMLRNHLLLNLHFGRDKKLVKPSVNEFPQNFPVLIKLQLRMFDDNHFKKALNLKGGQVRTARNRLNDRRSYKTEGGVCKFTANIGQNEARMIEEALAVLNCSDGIEYDDLIDDLKNMLKNLVHCADTKFIDENKKEIFGVLLCLMNNIEFSLMKGVNARTIVKVMGEDNAAVLGEYYLDSEGEPPAKTTWLSTVLHSNYLKTDLFDEVLTDDDLESGDIEFSFDLGRIVKM